MRSTRCVLYTYLDKQLMCCAGEQYNLKFCFVSVYIKYRNYGDEDESQQVTATAPIKQRSFFLWIWFWNTFEKAKNKNSYYSISFLH